MSRGCDHSVHVHFDIGVFAPVVKSPTAGRAPRTGKRHFIVEFNADGEVLRIKERRQYDHGPGISGVYNAPYWKAGTHALGSGDTVPKRIIAAARDKIEAEDKNADATS